MNETCKKDENKVIDEIEDKTILSIPEYELTGIVIKSNYLNVIIEESESKHFGYNIDENVSDKGEIEFSIYINENNELVAEIFYDLSNLTDEYSNFYLYLAPYFLNNLNVDIETGSVIMKDVRLLFRNMNINIENGDVVIDATDCVEEECNASIDVENGNIKFDIYDYENNNRNHPYVFNAVNLNVENGNITTKPYASNLNIDIENGTVTDKFYAINDTTVSIEVENGYITFSPVNIGSLTYTGYIEEGRKKCSYKCDGEHTTTLDYTIECGDLTIKN